MLDQSVVIGIVAVGMTFVILTGGIDLSVGSVAGLTGIILGLALQNSAAAGRDRWSRSLAGGLIGLVSGVLIAYFGLARLRRHARHHGDRPQPRLHPLRPDRDLQHPADMSATSSTPTSSASRRTSCSCCVLYLAGLGATSTYTKGGRTIYAVGSNKEAARAAGLNVLFYAILPYVVSGALSAVAVTLSIAQDPLGRPADGQSAGARRHRRRRHRRRQPVRRARLDHRHADRRASSW